MLNSVLHRFKHFLTVVGARIPFGMIHQIQMIVNYIKLGRWMRDANFSIEQRVDHRNKVFDAVINQVQDKHVLYLEFGVFEGRSMRYWSKALNHTDTMLHGFDSFEGLPEDFDVHGDCLKGHFNTQGALPQIDDSRVRFFKGWFDEVLPEYKTPAHDKLVIVIDADLYSSTKYVLDHFRSIIKPGTFIYFDDMSRPEHEPRAFQEFMQESGLRFRLIATDYSFNTSFFECVS